MAARFRLYSPRTARTTRIRVNNEFDFWVVRSRRRRSGDDTVDDCVEVIRERMAARIDVNGGIKGFDENGLINASFHPILLGR